MKMKTCLKNQDHWVWYCSGIDLCLMYRNRAIWGSWMGFCYVMVSRLGIVPCEWANFTSRHNLTSGTWNIMHIICINCTLNLLLWPVGVLLMSVAFILCCLQVWIFILACRRNCKQHVETNNSKLLWFWMEKVDGALLGP